MVKGLQSSFAKDIRSRLRSMYTTLLFSADHDKHVQHAVRAVQDSLGQPCANKTTCTTMNNAISTLLPSRCKGFWFSGSNTILRLFAQTSYALIVMCQGQLVIQEACLLQEAADTCSKWDSVGFRAAAEGIASVASGSIATAL